jgi:tRNA pseudouridine38-40 synthase
MRTFKLLVSYDGTNYSGWQIQIGKITVQETLEAAISSVTGQNVRILASGRTDAGVHALGQVVGFKADTRLSAEVLRRALNAILPRDMAVLEVAEVHDGFHPRYHAAGKRYRYLIHNGPVRDIFRRHYCWHYNQGRLDADAMQRAAVTLLGTHDFSSFESSGSERKTSVRTIFDIFVRRGSGGQTFLSADKSSAADTNVGPPDSDWITIEVEADGFLYNMVRAIVGALAEIGRGARDETWMAEILQSADRSLAGPTAPPQGLFLVKVDY